MINQAKIQTDWLNKSNMIYTYLKGEATHLDFPVYQSENQQGLQLLHSWNEEKNEIKGKYLTAILTAQVWSIKQE